MQVCVLPKRGGKVVNSCPGSAPHPLGASCSEDYSSCPQLTGFSRGFNEVVLIKQQTTPLESWPAGTFTHARHY